MSSPASLEALYIEACRLELRALKPGNVHVFGEGHGMRVADFEESARVSAGKLAMPGAPVGRRIREAVAATWAAVGCNTNLGIVLLAAPLIAAVELKTGGDLQTRLKAVLSDLSVADATDAYAAIRQAQPAGLGAAPAQDVAAAPTISLLEAMILAAPRDRIARQYASVYEDVFAIGVARLESAMRRGFRPEWAATLAYMGFLSAFPDSHIARKYGPGIAEAVREEAKNLCIGIGEGEETAEIRSALALFDRNLKERRINPGTSADLTVASLLAVSSKDMLPAF